MVTLLGLDAAMDFVAKSVASALIKPQSCLIAEAVLRHSPGMCQKQSGI
jgi:hypothetical protein